MAMDIQTFTIRNKLGLHARAAALLVKTANHFTADVMIEKDGIEVNGKSIMGILMLAASKGTKITLKTDGKGCRLRPCRPSVSSSKINLVRSECGESTCEQ